MLWIWRGAKLHKSFRLWSHRFLRNECLQKNTSQSPHCRRRETRHTSDKLMSEGINVHVCKMMLAVPEKVLGSSNNRHCTRLLSLRTARCFIHHSYSASNAGINSAIQWMSFAAKMSASLAISLTSTVSKAVCYKSEGWMFQMGWESLFNNCKRSSKNYAISRQMSTR